MNKEIPDWKFQREQHVQRPEVEENVKYLGN